MGLESATKISELNANWPLGSDPKSQGDDHLRLIKSVLQADAVTKESIDAIYPVGSIFFTTGTTDPNTFWPGTTWVAAAQGRVLVGVGDNGESEWTAGETRGSETHTQTEGELAKHFHPMRFKRDTSIDNAGAGAAIDVGTGQSDQTDTTGNDEPHNNLQPSLAVYMWERTA